MPSYRKSAVRSNKVSDPSLGHMVALADIMVATERLRAIQPAKVVALSESMQHPPRLLHPIAVQRLEFGGYKLIAGAHRLKAAKALGWTSIAATTLDDIDADQAKLAEIDENLIRAALSPAEEAAHLAARKAVYLKLHPETGHGGDRKSSSQVENLIPTFADDTATKIGQSSASVARKTARGEQVEDVGSLAGTSLNKGAELDALAKQPKEKQRKLAKKAKAGQKVSARPLPVKKKAKTAKSNTALDSIAFCDADLAARQKYFDKIPLKKVLEALPLAWRPHVVTWAKDLSPDDMPKALFAKLTPAHLPPKLITSILSDYGRYPSDTKLNGFVASLKPGTTPADPEAATDEPPKPHQMN